MMDITELPEHIFIDIAKHLSTDDLLACSLVNSSWRNAVNCNDIWRYICKNVIISKTGDELDRIPNLVMECKNLYTAMDFEPLCKWRKTYMRWEKLKKNWLNGNYKRYNIDEMVAMFNTIECDDNVALIVCTNLREISVWNIKLVPYHQEIIKFCMDHVCSEFQKLCNNYLVIVQCNLLQVFLNTEKGFVLHYKSLFDKPECQSKKLPPDQNISEWYRSNIDLYPCDLTLRCEQNGDKFIGMILDGDYNNSVFHIWDLHKKTKDIEVLIPRSTDAVSDIKLSVTKKCLYLMLKKFDSNHCYNSLYVYDLQELKFLDFKIDFTYVVPAFLVCKEIVIAVDKNSKRINVWKIKSKLCKVLECNFEIELRCFNVECSHLLISGKCSDSLTKVCVYHLSNLDCVFAKKISCNVGFISLIQNRFLILGMVSSYHYCTVIDMLKGCFLYDIKDDDCLFVNSIHSKLLTRIDTELNVITFW